MILPASSQAAAIEWLWWLMFWVSAVVLAAVLVLLGIGLWRGRDARDRVLDRIASRNLVLAGGVVIPALVLVGLVVGSVRVGAEVMGQAPAGALSIELRGHLWWWEVRYLDGAGRTVAVTANEIHVPVGRPVNVLLRSDNVIHSFWAPNLQGKRDLIPGQDNSAWFEVDRPGVFRGQCAEFCGVQHALMAFEIVAEDEATFRRWLAVQAAPAAPVAGTPLARAPQLFVDAGCAACHSIRGTPARGTLGPDLTHFGSRRTIAAATLPNTPANLGGWISNPRHIKPGVYMPATRLEPHQHALLVAWLESLR